MPPFLFAAIAVSRLGAATAAFTLKEAFWRPNRWAFEISRLAAVVESTSCGILQQFRVKRPLLAISTI